MTWPCSDQLCGKAKCSLHPIIHHLLSGTHSFGLEVKHMYLQMTIWRDTDVKFLTSLVHITDQMQKPASNWSQTQAQTVCVGWVGVLLVLL